MHVEEVLDQEVTALAGERYARKDASIGGRRHPSNPGTVRLAGQRVPIRVPRVRGVAGREIALRAYEALHGDGAVHALLLQRVLYGISCRNYEAAAEAIPGAIGLSGSTVSRGFIEASAAKLQERDLAAEDVVAILLDGKTFADATMVIALGVTLSGEKRFLGFVETDTENARVLTVFLRSLVERGLDLSQGVLVILDGGKGLRAAVRKAFRHRALVQPLRVGPWRGAESLPGGAASPAVTAPPPPSHASVRRMGDGDVCLLKGRAGTGFAGENRAAVVKLTMPCQVLLAPPGRRASDPAAVRRHAAEDLGATGAGRLTRDRVQRSPPGEERAQAWSGV